MSDIELLLLGAAIGCISTILTAVIVDPLKRHIYGPKLTVEFEGKGSHGFFNKTKARVMTQNPESHQAQIQAVTEARYVRVRVRNTGHQIAKQCRAYLVNVEKWNNAKGDFETTAYCDSIQLAWSCRGEERFSAIDLPRDIHQFVDVVSSRKITNDYRVEIMIRLFRYTDLFKETGKFRYTMQVSGDNVKPATKSIIFDWQGFWDKFEVSGG